ncbi:hypothetical protein [Sphaerisporangium fuscum]|uniref:hypothetical protein n=1 Tax=Sphaerisporangium fuscum TaxID=2835868 RepID=UPI001BDD8A7D|nr:hypothetical protein [Sphaerisporangium fuscum]
MTGTEVEHVRRPDTIEIRIPALKLGPIVLAGLTLIAASLAVKISVMSHSYFIEDDFLFVGDSYEHGLTWDYLMRVHKGHLMPGALALVWGLSRLSPYNWALVNTVMLAMQAAASAGMLWLLRRLFGERPGILVPLALYLFAPLTVPALSWWSAALNAVPLQVAMVFSLAAHVRYLRTGAVRHAWWGLGWAVFGMAFSTKGVFLPLVTFALTTAYFGQRTGWLPSIIAELRHRTKVWGAYVVVLGLYALVYLLQQGTAGDEGAGTPKLDVSVGLVGWLLGKTFPTGVVGGPMRWGGVAATGGLADPAPVMVAVAWLALAAVVVFTILFRRHAWRAWTVAALYVIVADTVPTILARGRYTPLVGAETRYVADAALVFAICFALSSLPLKGEQAPYRRPWPDVMPMVTALATVVFLVLSIATINSYSTTLVAGDRVRPYLDNVRASLAKAPKNAEIYTRPVPDYVVIPWNGERRLSHHLLSPLADEALRTRMHTPGPSDKPYVFDDWGHLVPVDHLFGYFDMVKNRKCYQLRSGAITFPAESAGGPDAVGAVGYTSPRPVSVDVTVGTFTQRLDLPASPAFRLFFFPHPGVGAGMRVALATPGGEGFCLKSVAFGGAIPKSAP